MVRKDFETRCQSHNKRSSEPVNRNHRGYVKTGSAQNIRVFILDATRISGLNGIGREKIQFDGKRKYCWRTIIERVSKLISLSSEKSVLVNPQVAVACKRYKIEYCLNYTMNPFVKWLHDSVHRYKINIPSVG